MEPTAFDYEKLVQVIRSEIDRSLDSVKTDLHDIKSSLGNQYSREMIDQLLKQRDAEREGLGARVEEVERQVGSFWMNTITRVAAVLGVVALVVELVKGLM